MCIRDSQRLGLKYLDLYLIHTPFAFQPGDDQDPRDQNGNVIYDQGVTLLDTWKAMETLVDHGKCRAIGLSDIGLNELKPIYELSLIHISSANFAPNARTTTSRAVSPRCAKPLRARKTPCLTFTKR